MKLPERSDCIHACVCKYDDAMCPGDCGNFEDIMDYEAEHTLRLQWENRCKAAENVFKGSDLGFEGADFINWQSTVKAMEEKC